MESKIEDDNTSQHRHPMESQEPGLEASDMESARTGRNEVSQGRHPIETQEPASEASDMDTPTLDEEKANALEPSKSAVSLAEQLSLPREIAFVFIICMAQFMTQVGLGQCIAILHIIGDSYGLTNPGELSWLIAAYSLTVGTFILISGRLGDLFGYKRLLIIGFSWFTVWTMIAGLAVYSNHVLFNFARAFQGIGPAIILPNGLAILGATYAPGSRKNMVFSLFGACAPTGSVVGSVFAGLFALAWWPWTFWSFAIVLVFTTVAAVLIVPDPPRRVPANKSLREKISDLDLLGATTGILALVLINFAWNQAPIVGWSQPYVYVILIIGVLFVPVFFLVETRVAESPLIPFEAFSADVSFVLACIACGWSCFGIWFYYTWQFFQELRGGSPLLASAWICPVAVSGVIAAISTGMMLSKVGPAWTMTIALTAFTVGTILIATAPVDQTYWAQSFVGMIIIPWGMDMSFPAATIILSNAVKKEHQGISASLVNTIVNYSISLGLGFAGTIEVHVNRGGATQADVLHGYRGAWYMGIGLAGLGLCISLLYTARGYWVERRKE